MVPALILVLATAWCPTTTTTAPDRPQCPCPSTTSTTAPVETTTAPPTTTTSGPVLMIEPPHLVPPTATTAPTTTTTVPVIVDAAHLTRPETEKRLPATGPNGDELVVAGTLILAGGLLIAARPGRHQSR